MIKRGDSGLHVTKIQNALIARRITDHENKPLVADGDFGLRTENAVKKFQSISGLSVTGVVDANTGSKLGLSATDLNPTSVTLTATTKSPVVSTSSSKSFMTPVYNLFGGRTNTFVAIGLMVGIGASLYLFLPKNKTAQ